MLDVNGLILLVGLSILYIFGGIFFRKKEKPSLWNSLLFGCVVFLLSIIFRGNYLFRIPSFESSSMIIVIIYISLLSLMTGFYGTYMKEEAAYKWNVLFIRPVVLEMGFTGLVLPYLHHVPILQNWIQLIIIPVTLGLIIVVTVQVILNIIDKEYRMSMWKQIIYDIIVISLNGVLVMATQSIWIALLPRGIYVLIRLYRIKRWKTERFSEP